MGELSFFCEVNSEAVEEVVLGEFETLVADSDLAVRDGVVDAFAHLLACAEVGTSDQSDVEWLGDVNLYCFVDTIGARVCAFYTKKDNDLIALMFAKIQNGIPSKDLILAARRRLKSYRDSMSSI